MYEYFLIYYIGVHSDIFVYISGRTVCNQTTQQILIINEKTYKGNLHVWLWKKYVTELSYII